MFDQSKNTGAIDVKMDRSVLEEKSFFEMLGLTFSSNGWKIHYFVCLLCVNEVTINRLSVMPKYMRKTHVLDAIYLVKKLECE